ncbi:TPA: preprotein translocase subunit SecE [Candidatus Dependentiae bacterium]|nr:MAG: Preprotein translocase SecE subunit [candidate division TM6 bacterium GW2011_GWF2_43_87]HBL98421.1 preprotein translocase subunit SecE [Candidatus Dependentiae bacterium]
MKNIGRFFSEVRTELLRVEWPKFNEFVGATVVVLFLVLVFSIFLGAVDRVIMWIIKWIFAQTI